MDTIDRTKILVRHLILTGKISSQKDLGEKLGYTNESSFSQVINNKVPFPKKTVKNIKTLFPEINTNWLITGEGEMLKDCQNYNNNGVLINGSNTNSPINNKHYYSDALQTQNEQLLERVKEKDEQIKEKDAQIKSLLAIIEKQTTKGI